MTDPAATMDLLELAKQLMVVLREAANSAYLVYYVNCHEPRELLGMSDI